MSHAAGIGIVGGAGGNRDHADSGRSNLVLGGGRGGLSGGSYASEDQNDDEGTNDMFHSGIPLKLYLQKKISLDKPDEVTIGYILE